MHADRSRSPYGHAPVGSGQLPGAGAPVGGGKLPDMVSGLGWGNFMQPTISMEEAMAIQAAAPVMTLPGGVSHESLVADMVNTDSAASFNFQQVAQQQTQEQQLAAAHVAAVAVGAAPPPGAAAAAQLEEDRKREEAEAAARLKLSIERNEGYFQPQQPLGYVLNNEALNLNYTIIDKSPLGFGVFSVVWPCADSSNKFNALKMIRSQDHFRKYANKEVEIMQRVKDLSEHDEQGAAQVAMLRDHFVHKVGNVEHLCMAFEKLETNLRTAGKQPLEKVLKFSKQILVALRYLHDVVGLVHCDVKPDNLLLRWDGLSVKLCDFGTARFPTADLQVIDELQPLFYRAPEVFMGDTRGRKIDLWSAGCTIYELTVGRILFRSCGTHRELMEMIMKISGPVPASMREQGRLTRNYFSRAGFHPEIGAPVDPEKTYKKTSMLMDLMPHVDFGKSQARAASDLAKAQLSKLIGRTTVVGAAEKKKKGSQESESEKKVRLLADLVERCMDINPATRISAKEACEHDALQVVELPPPADLMEAPPLPAEAPPPLPPPQ